MANNQSVRRHLDAFTRGRIIGKLEKGRSVTSQKKQAADSGRNHLTHDTGDWTTDIAFYRGQKTARWWSVCTTPCTVCTFNACPSEKAFSVVPGTPELERQ
ncbi:hypothetical protein TNCV_4331381 [Trichonephila clavipes]|nr:hypothetical protein TNCV_4331381 [Trichonephila clavipes]